MNHGKRYDISSSNDNNEQTVLRKESELFSEIDKKIAQENDDFRNLHAQLVSVFPNSKIQEYAIEGFMESREEEKKGLDSSRLDDIIKAIVSHKKDKRSSEVLVRVDKNRPVFIKKQRMNGEQVIRVKGYRVTVPKGNEGKKIIKVIEKNIS